MDAVKIHYTNLDILEIISAYFIQVFRKRITFVTSSSSVRRRDAFFQLVGEIILLFVILKVW